MSLPPKISIALVADLVREACGEEAARRLVGAGNDAWRARRYYVNWTSCKDGGELLLFSECVSDSKDVDTPLVALSYPLVEVWMWHPRNGHLALVMCHGCEEFNPGVVVDLLDWGAVFAELLSLGYPVLFFAHDGNPVIPAIPVNREAVGLFSLARLACRLRRDGVMLERLVQGDMVAVVTDEYGVIFREGMEKDSTAVLRCGDRMVFMKDIAQVLSMSRDEMAVAVRVRRRCGRWPWQLEL